jgi:Alkylmercury lyase
MESATTRPFKPTPNERLLVGREHMMTIELNSATLHHAILRHLVDRGCAPSLASLARNFGVDTGVMAAALRELQDMHGVVMHPHVPEVWIAHPFSTAPTPFAVRHGARVWWGNCAWCSLGVAALVGGTDVTIQTTLGAEGQPVTVHVDGERVLEDLWVHFPIAMTRVWDNVVYTCSTMLVFDSELAIDGWCARHALPRGDAQPIQRAYDFASIWYGRHLDPDWSKWTLDEARQIFNRLGFRGPVWALPESGQRF